MKKLAIFLVLAFAFTMIFSSAAVAEEEIEITYWQYFYESRVEAMDELIEQFEEEYPHITVNHETFPYEDYNVRVSSAVPVGEGPDVLQLFYGWLPRYIEGEFLQPLPEEHFSQDEIEDEFYDLVEASKVDGDYYALPTAVRSLALVQNDDLLEQAGLDPDSPPETLDELVEYADQATVRDGGGNILQAGMSVQIDSQLHHWMRQVLVEQFGGQPYSDDYREVLFDEKGGEEALEFITDLQLEHEVGYYGFLTTDIDAFEAGQLAMTMIGSFTLGQFQEIPHLNFSVSELPSHEGRQSNFASYWANGINSNLEGERLEAASKFLQFITSDEAMDLWLDTVGELPAKPEIAEEYIDHEYYGPFIEGLEYATATYFLDESAQREHAIDAFENVIHEDYSIEEAVEEWAENDQEVLDDYWEDQ